MPENKPWAKNRQTKQIGREQQPNILFPKLKNGLQDQNKLK